MRRDKGGVSRPHNTSILQMRVAEKGESQSYIAPFLNSRLVNRYFIK